MDQILKSTLKDIRELRILINNAYRGSAAKEGWTNESDLLDGQRIDDEELIRLISDQFITILKYVRNGKIIGCVLLKQNDNEIYLGMLSVMPVLQAAGIGKKLLDASEIHALNRNCDLIKMTVFTIRKELIEWYKRHGYNDTGIKSSFDPGDNRFGKPKIELEFSTLSKLLRKII